MNTTIRKRPSPGLFTIGRQCLAALVLPLAWMPVIAHTHDHEVRPPNIDVRTTRKDPASGLKPAEANRLRELKNAHRHSIAKGLARMRSRVPGLEVKASEGHGGVEMLSAPGPLSAAAPGLNAQDIARAFLHENASVFALDDTDQANLCFLGESVNRISGLRMVRVVQVVNGIPVFQSETRITIDREGRVIRCVGALMPGASAIAPPALANVTPEAALASALSATGIPVAQAEITRSPRAERKDRVMLTVAGGKASRDVPSELVYFPMGPGLLVPAWSQVTFTKNSGSWYTLVNANSGDLIWRKNLQSHASSQEARFQVYVQGDGKTPSDSPSPSSPSAVSTGSHFQPSAIPRTVVKMSDVQDPVASPDGWIPDDATTTRGNNVHAYLDIEDLDSPNTSPETVLDGEGRPIGNPDASGRNRDFLGSTPRSFGMSPAPQGSDPDAGQDPTGTGFNGTTSADAFRRGLVTQLFYTSNWYHDQLYALGFDEAAGNFQTDNFDHGGSGNDEVQAEAQDGSGTDNANFATPPDGEPGRMQMYIFTGPAVPRDGSLDIEVVTHELTHGLSNRLVGNGSGLNWDVGGSLGEGWSDFYALSLLNNTMSDDPDGVYAAGGYATYMMEGLTDNYLYGIRRFPYSTDNSISPLTWADLDDTTYDESGGIAASPLNFSEYGAGEVHGAGEIWCLSLWEMRSRIITDPAGAAGNVPEGNLTALAIVTDALKLTPANPTFIEARDALLAADAAAFSSRNEQWIWEAFADRGLGYKAVAPFSRMGGAGFTGHIGIGESFDLPYLDVVSVTVNDSTTGNNNGVLDPGEPAELIVKLKNPWMSNAKSVPEAAATLATSTAGMILKTTTATYPAIGAGQTVEGTPFAVRVPAGIGAGTALRFQLNVSSALGTHKSDFMLRVGKPVGEGAPLTYTRNIAGGLLIPDGTPRGVTDAFVITDDVEIADLDFKVESLIHDYVGDLTLMLKAPNGAGSDVIIGIGTMEFFGGGGENLIDTVIDDEAEGDLLSATSEDAPYSGSYKPAFNSNALDGYGLSADPVGVLSRFDGMSTRGEWKVLASDQGYFSEGSLESWSLIVTPVLYEGQTFVGKADIAVADGLGFDVADGATVNFAGAYINDPKALTYTIRNVGTAPLSNLSVTIDGADPEMFSAMFSNPGQLPEDDSVTLTIVFSPLSEGPLSAELHLYSNDPDESPFDLLLTGVGIVPPPDSPELSMEQPAGVMMPDGGVRAFGEVAVGETRELDFRLSNLGVIDLTGLGITFTGPDADMFSVEDAPVPPLPPGTSTTFRVVFTPSRPGTISAALQMANNDPNEAPFDVVFSATATAKPDIVVEFPEGNELPLDGTVHFGDIGIGAGSVLTFTVRNAGLVDLDNLAVTIDGPDATLFDVLTDPSSPVLPAGTTTFRIIFSPTSPGPREAALHIQSNDPDENPFNLNLTGYRYTALENWRKSHFSVTNNVGIAANEADNDGDGIPNLVEFAFNLNPDADSSGLLPSAQFSGGNLFMTFTQPPGVSGITYGAEWGTGLSGSSGTPVPDTGVHPVHTFSVPIGVNTRIYLRLTITEL